MNRIMEGPTKIAHIGIAVESIDAALPFYRDSLGLEVSEILELPERGLRIAMLPCGESMLELMEPLGPDSQISRFLEKRGQGIHHLCLGVTELQARLDALDERGVPLVNRNPEIGAEGLPVAFIHPKASSGVLLELLEED
jgi:methylmalonyl-CoA epimerase